MEKVLGNLEPQVIWDNFSKLNEVPRPSKKEERVINFIVEFGKSLHLETTVDQVGNVLIKKPATASMKDRQTVVLQSHLDMVHQKNNDTVFNFDEQGIQMYVDQDWVRAKGTTLGADNGIGVATIMSLLESTDIEHPAIEALFTIDEETGMSGAKGLKGGWLSGTILLNLDTENDAEIDIGCAGGIDITAQKSFQPTEINPDEFQAIQIEIKGLHGGHSGMDIHKGYGNANKLMNRLLYKAFENHGVHIVNLLGGSLRNAIPRESVCTIVVPKSTFEAWKTDFEALVAEIKQEFKTIEPNLTIETSSATLSDNKVLPFHDQINFINAVYAAHNGVYKMSVDFEDLVETSNNIARVEVKDGQISIQCLTRSSVESSKTDLANTLRAAFELAGFTVDFSGDYPGWKPNPDSAILKTLTGVYEQNFGTQPEVVACHAGLECGILGTNYPGMDMISFGPTILGAHSPAERVSISSVQKFWHYLQDILKAIPVK